MFVFPNTVTVRGLATRDQSKCAQGRRDEEVKQRLKTPQNLNCKSVGVMPPEEGVGLVVSPWGSETRFWGMFHGSEQQKQNHKVSLGDPVDTYNRNRKCAND
ncbi:hypothetical protein GCM10012275_07840 [Longimycelium tulufanense]|uniref:Uncharacterized protein n=1 Tax=Longimycelium tulufanense TaxID=907463 RepID=A0A8J3C6G2_9PSEU|nr:hypothetical protein GCM10012275_07840 [Longimycelium tulufanense]